MSIEREPYEFERTDAPGTVIVEPNAEVIGPMTTTTQGVLHLLTDDELVNIWQRCGGECDDPVAEAIIEEMARREIDF